MERKEEGQEREGKREREEEGGGGRRRRRKKEEEEEEDGGVAEMGHPLTESYPESQGWTAGSGH